MTYLAEIRKLLDDKSLRRLGAALWFMVGNKVDSRDLAWASSLLGEGGDRLVLGALHECSALSPIGILDAVQAARFLEQICTKEPVTFRELPQLIWTLPPQHPLAHQVPCTYINAIIEVIGESTQQLLITSPFLQQEGVVPLTKAISSALYRGVMVRVLTHEADHLSSSQSIAVEELRREAERIGGSFWVYTSNTSFLLHAKLVVADRNRMILGSANLTRPGLSHNLEAGVVLGEREATEMLGIVDGLMSSGLMQMVIGPTRNS
jgi:phosphatidylserine/phosphatidylglycerophosphate/cardiolipin synthase-like enzyme